LKLKAVQGVVQVFENQTLRARIVEAVDETSSMEREYFSGSLDRATSSTKLQQIREDSSDKDHF
jgi:hypothetical protein